MLIAKGSKPSCRPQMVKYRRLLTSWPRLRRPTCDRPRLQTGMKPAWEAEDERERTRALPAITIPFQHVLAQAGLHYDRLGQSPCPSAGPQGWRERKTWDTPAVDTNGPFLGPCLYHSSSKELIMHRPDQVVIRMTGQHTLRTLKALSKS